MGANIQAQALNHNDGSYANCRVSGRWREQESSCTSQGLAFRRVSSFVCFFSAKQLKRGGGALAHLVQDAD